MTIFEKIILKEIPSHIVYEDDLVIAFLDISQATKGHTLVVPKTAYKDIFEIPDNILSHLIVVAKKLAKAIDKAFAPKGINLLNNNKEAAGQTVFHFHIHIIPRYSSNDVSFAFTNNMNNLSSNDYKERASAICAAL
ncbi:MAG: HIT family protein [Acholeplasma sp.]|nr:HIT family protein [Acholeplasma sp.]